jgi:beta-glucanase (GH16 family)
MTIEYLLNENFDGAAGTGPNPSNWVFDLGPGAVVGGNNELEIYVSDLANCFTDGQYLHIRALNPSPGVYTSARIKTLGKFAHYGRTWESRIKVNPTDGFWPAWWVMGSAPSQWPQSGEIDVLENYGSNPIIETSVHTPGPKSDPGNMYTVSKQQPVDSNFHTYRMFINEPGNGDLIFHMDNVEYLTVTPAQMKNWCYSQGNPLYCLLNLAVGGNGTGNITPEASAFPVEMLVDYVHCW